MKPIDYSINSGWKIKKLKYLISQKITDGPHETPNFIDDGIPFLSVDSIQDGELVFENCRYVAKEEHYKYIKKCNPKKGDILFGKAASIGKIATVNVDFEFSVWSPLALIKLNNIEVRSRFMAFALKSDYVQDQISIFSTLNTQKNISMDDIAKLEISFPPTFIQDKIINFLENKICEINIIIKKNEKLIELLKEKRQAIIMQTITKGLNPNAKMKDSGIDWIGLIPHQWNLIKLRFVTLNVLSGVTPKGGSEIYQNDGVALIRSQNVQFDGLDLNDIVFISEDINKSMLHSQVEFGDVLLNITGASIGRCTYIPQDFQKANVNQHVCVIRPDKDKLDMKFLNYFLISTLGQMQIKANNYGISRDALNFNQIKNLVILLPNIETQKEIIKYLDILVKKINLLIEKTKNQNQKLQEFRQALISNVVTGKIKV